MLDIFKKKQNLLYIIAGTLLGLSLILTSFKKSAPAIAEQQAIAIIKQNFPDTRTYPSNSLPPTSIITERDGEGWHLAFMINGSGRPFISGQCFLVKPDKSFLFTGALSTNHPDDLLNFSAKKCELY